MRAQRQRTKKLIVAFHFYRHGNEAGWRCDACRRDGLTEIRNCGFAGTHDRNRTRPVWARGRVWTAQCPRSYITAETSGFIEEYAVFMAFGIADFQVLPARLVDALLTLRSEDIQEINDGEQN